MAAFTFTTSNQPVGGCIIGADGKSVCTLINLNDGTNTVPRTDGGGTPPPVQSTGTPTPANVQNDPNASTVLTSAGGLLAEAGAIIANPSQHIFGVIVLLAIGWFIWK